MKVPSVCDFAYVAPKLAAPGDNPEMAGERPFCVDGEDPISRSSFADRNSLLMDAIFDGDRDELVLLGEMSWSTAP